MKYIIFGLLFISQIAFANQSIDKVLGVIPVQENGRLKPYNTFAMETLQLIYGKKKYVAKDGSKKDATEIVLTWILLPEHWDKLEFIEVNNHELKEKLQIEKTAKYFSPNNLLSNDRTALLFSELELKRKAKEKLDPFFQAVDRLQNQLTLYKAIVHGLAPHFAPPSEGDKWLSLSEMNDEQKQAFVMLTEGFMRAIEPNGNTELLKTATKQFMEISKKSNPSLYPPESKIKWEIFYNNFHPFQKAWIFYALSAIFAMAFFISPKPVLNRISWIMVIGGFVFHTLGFILRVYISGRPPVSNMYETVVWVPWASIIFAFIFYRQLRNKFLIFAASIISFICMVVADMAPFILDASVQPLEAVLRSNFWLIIHVLTITVSYGAFFLAFVLGDIALVFYLMGEEKRKAELDSLRDTIYRAIQVGVVLLAAGTILGGIWADYSWGRFWGWDPKETWAFIALLGYLALLHARLSGWIKTFGLCVGAVISFNLVIMAWYGVNYILGAGLHSYGFGGGGVTQVSIFTLCHFIFVGTVAAIRYSRLKTT